VPEDRHPFYSASLPLISVALVAQGAGWLLRWSFPAVGSVIAVLATLVLIVGLAFRAKDKGRSLAWGLCGLLSLVGVIIVAMLSNRANRTAHN
jgi:hypothetical protein